MIIFLFIIVSVCIVWGGWILVGAATIYNMKHEKDKEAKLR